MTHVRIALSMLRARCAPANTRIGLIRELRPNPEMKMSREKAAAELNEELEQIIISAIQAQKALKTCKLSEQEMAEWANLVFGFNNSFGYMFMNMQTPHRTKEFH